MARQDKTLMSTPEGRKALAKHNPLIFAAIYMPHMLYRAEEGETIADVTINQFHMDVINYGLTWTKPLKEFKVAPADCFIAPRKSGKSTWINLILPIWAGAFMHKKYIFAFSSKDDQAKAWLRNFKQEIASNALLQADFPEFCSLMKIGDSARSWADNMNLTQRGNGFVLQVAGADNNILGANINGVRPQVIIFDDIEPTESNYSVGDAAKRLNTVLSSHFYLNLSAIKVFIGTTTMPDSIIDQMRKVGDAKKEFLESNEWDKQEFKAFVEKEHQWVVNNNINTHYWPAILNEGTTDEQPLWPDGGYEWSLEAFSDIRKTRDFMLNMMNRPVSLSDAYWEDSDLVVEDVDPELFTERTVLIVDPAVTTKKDSDYTGFVVATRGTDGNVYIRYATGKKLNSSDLNDFVIGLITKYDVKVVVIETNQGGDLWKQVFDGIPAKLRLIRNTEKKEHRIAQAFDVYRGQKNVIHCGHFAMLEEQMLAYPNVNKDDVVDALASAVLYFAKSEPKKQAGGVTANYITGGTN